MTSFFMSRSPSAGPGSRIAAIFGLILLAGHANSAEEVTNSRSLDAVSFVTLGISSFFQPEAKRYTIRGHPLYDQDCVAVKSALKMETVSSLLERHDGVLGRAGCFTSPLEHVDHDVERFALIRCYYAAGRRLMAISKIDRTAQNRVINGMQQPLFDAYDAVVSSLDERLHEIDACFASSMGMEGWYDSYGANIMSRFEAYSDLELRR